MWQVSEHLKVTDMSENDFSSRKYMLLHEKPMSFCLGNTWVAFFTSCLTGLTRCLHLLWPDPVYVSCPGVINRVPVHSRKCPVWMMYFVITLRLTDIILIGIKWTLRKNTIYLLGRLESFWETLTLLKDSNSFRHIDFWQPWIVCIKSAQYDQRD